MERAEKKLCNLAKMKIYSPSLSAFLEPLNLHFTDCEMGFIAGCLRKNDFTAAKDLLTRLEEKQSSPQTCSDLHLLTALYHAQVCNWELVEKYCHKIFEENCLCSVEHRLWALVFLCKKSLHLGHTADAVQWLNKAEQVRQSASSDDKGLSAWLFYQRAAVSYQRAHYKETLALLNDYEKELFGSENDGLLSSVYLLKIRALADYGSKDEARELVKIWQAKALEDSAELQLGQAYAAFSIGELEEAYSRYVAAEDKYRQLFKGEHQAIAYVLEERAKVLQELEQFEESTDLLKESLRIKEELFGEEHPYCCKTLLKMAHLAACMDDFDHANQLLDESVDILQVHYLPNHPWLLESLLTRGMVQHISGHSRVAVQTLVKALEGLKGVYGMEHPLVLETLRHIGLAHLQLGNAHKAVTAVRDGLQAARAFLRDDHERVRYFEELLTICEQQHI